MLAQVCQPPDATGGPQNRASCMSSSAYMLNIKRRRQTERQSGFVWRDFCLFIRKETFLPPVSWNTTLCSSMLLVDLVLSSNCPHCPMLTCYPVTGHREGNLGNRVISSRILPGLAHLGFKGSQPDA